MEPMALNQIITEIIIPTDGGKQHSIFPEASAKIRIGDEGAGPYLKISGSNLSPTEDETGNEFFLCSAEEIDQFANICKKMLKQATG